MGLGLAPGDITLPRLCSPFELGLGPGASLKFVVMFNPPAALALDWALMIAAMMPPLVIASLRHIGDRSFARRRWRAMTLFGAGYAIVWMAAGTALLPLALVCRFAARETLLPLASGAAVAFAWQISPAKQWCLNRCHRRPALAAFGVAADRDAFAFGLSQGVWCVGACWALMMVPLLSGQAHLLAMMAVALLLTAERIEPPAAPGWRFQPPSKALRIAVAQLRMRFKGSAQTR